MTDGLRERLWQLCELVEWEMQHLQATDQRLFERPFDAQRAASLAHDDALAERVDAFVARFGRLQDTLGDKLMPALLRWLGQPPAPVLDNLRSLEQWGWLANAEAWLEARALRNRLIHEYQKDPALLADALNLAHERVGLLVATAQRLITETRRRLPSAP
ncbi:MULTISPECIES: hypothetical protein [unclassified Tepidimonas]|uniref:hypothetical protein n=1 Tax=unclassified Tepidimonas TaxID=2631705 RepID=UPI00262D8E10|nr:hypothetical protein [uncultured Tepidimonas sp.]